jgi:tetratricopeptide (TPR) repeat protein
MKPFDTAFQSLANESIAASEVANHAAALSAARSMERIAKDDEQRVFALSMQVHPLLMMGQNDQAWKIIESAKNFSAFDKSEFLQALIFREEAGALLCTGDTKGALAMLDKILDKYDDFLQRDDMVGIYQQLLAERGICRAKEEAWIQAISDLEIGRKIDFWPGLTNFLLSRCYLERGSTKEAAVLMEEALRRGLDTEFLASAHYHLAVALFRLQDFTRALQELEKAEGASGESFIYRKDLYALWSDCLKAVGKTSEAVQYKRLSESLAS